MVVSDDSWQVDGVFGVGAEDLEDPEDLRDQGKQPFDHDWAYVTLHVIIASIPVAYDHKCR